MRGKYRLARLNVSGTRECSLTACTVQLSSIHPQAMQHVQVKCSMCSAVSARVLLGFRVRV
jgi:hypothetical protein